MSLDPEAAVAHSQFVKMSLKEQLESARFERALQATEGLADHRALLTTAELGRLNGIITGKTSDPWRHQTVTITLPSGRTETMELIVDPVMTARDKLHRATATAEAGSSLDAALEVYINLILSHVFEDANRRTAALACHYFLKRYGIPLSGIAILDLGIGDLRQPEQIESLKAAVQQMLKFSEKKSKNPTSNS